MNCFLYSVLLGHNPDHLHPVPYFQWIEVILIISGILLNIPRTLYNQLQKSSFQNVIVDDQKKLLLNMQRYLHPTTMNHASRIIIFFLFQVMNFFVVALLIFIASVIMQRNFLIFGLDVLNGIASPFADSVFPKNILCNIKTVSRNGKLSDNGVVCLVSINYINEAIFCIAYIWILFLILAGLLNILYIGLQLMPCFQVWSMEHSSESRIEQKKLKRIASSLPWATRLVWIQMASILPSNVYSDLIVKIVQLVPKSLPSDKPENVEQGEN